MDLKSVDILALQTKAMQADKTTQGVCAALTHQMQQLAADTDRILIWSNIDNLPENVIDEVAEMLNVDFYDSESDIIIKRQLVKTALPIKQYKGTPYAVEQLITAYFGEGRVLEWFEYGGQPYYFKVYTRNPRALTDLHDKFIRALNAVKNARSHLDDVYVVNRVCGDDGAPALFGSVCGNQTYL